MKKIYEELRSFIDTVPVIDTHEHTRGYSFSPEYKEPIFSLIQSYLQIDLVSAGATEREMEIFNNQEVSTEEKWEKFENFWKKIENTGFAKVTKIIMERFYGEKELSLTALKRIGKKLLNLRDERVYNGILQKANIKCRLTNILYSHIEVASEIKNFIDGKYKLLPIDRIVIPLIMFHIPIRNKEAIERIGKVFDCEIKNLEQFLEVCYGIFKKMKEKGAIGMKDQSAYERIINFENRTFFRSRNII